MVCNEEARLIPLPYNKLASYLYGYDQHGQMVCGNVLILKNGVTVIDGIEELDIVGMEDTEIEKVLKRLNELKKEADASLLMAPPSRQQIQTPEITISTFEDEDALNVIFAAGTTRGQEAFEEKVDNAIRNEERKEAKENGNV